MWVARILNMDIDGSELLTKALGMLIEFGPKIVLAVLVLWLGLKGIDKIVGLMVKPFGGDADDKTLKTFVKSLLTWVFKIMLFISVASMIGIKTTSFVAVLGAAGLAVGLALQGTLANFAGGVLCLMFKPYKVGDIISTQNVKGKVKEIQIFTTIMVTRNNEAVIIPNGSIMNGNIINHSLKGKLRVEVEMSVSTSVCFDKLKETILKNLGSDENIFHTPKPKIGILSIDGDTMGIFVGVWCEPDSYWNVYFSTLELSKKSIEAVS